ncbi:phage tail terminator family protein [Romboutsia sp. 1001285H_161024_C4]|uniref:phage tail terminator family protein n=1 Tax=Romboutsia sp. 1001285H_161024_C4 TaxID=2787109 RepID=UPI0018983543|nr:hypothetical protein [Romboutsia sp. 1001285H_161024_C4]
MLTYTEIIEEFTRTLRREFGYDIFTSSINQGFDSKCFYVSLIDPKIERISRTLVSHNLTISIKYFNNGEKMNLYDVGNRLQDLFNQTIKIKDRVITLSNNELTFLRDEVGELLDFLLPISYTDKLKKTKEQVEYEDSLEFMKEIKINSEVIQ